MISQRRTIASAALDCRPEKEGIETARLQKVQEKVFVRLQT